MFQKCAVSNAMPRQRCMYRQILLLRLPSSGMDALENMKLLIKFAYRTMDTLHMTAFIANLWHVIGVDLQCLTPICPYWPWYVGYKSCEWIDGLILDTNVGCLK